MISLKRTIGFLTAAIIVGTAIPAQSANPHQVPNNNRALITASPYYQRFNPQNGPAQVTLRVTGSTALDVRVRVFRSQIVTPGQANAGIICNDNPTYKIADLVNPYSQLATGSHVVSWSGVNAANRAFQDGAYCYRVEWSNYAAGVRNLVQGTFLIDSSLPVTRRNGGAAAGNNNNNNGGAQNNGNNGNNGNVTIVWNTGGGSSQIPVQSTTSTQEPTGPSVTFGINPQDIYPESSTQNTAIIAYRVNETLPKGLKIAIVDGRNVELRTLYSNTGRLSPTASSVSWNGRSQLTGRAYAAATYSVVFKTNGREFARGDIRVHSGNAPAGGNNNNNGGTPINNNPDDISVRVHPTTIYPASNNPSINTAQLDYRVKRTLTKGLTITIFGLNGAELKKHTITTGALRPVSGSVSWNGRYTNGSIVPFGSYRYTFRSGNTELASGYIQVKPLGNIDPTPDPDCCIPSSKPVITDYGPNPGSFVQGGTTKFSFKVSQTANATFTLYKDNKKVVTLLPQSQVTANTTKNLTWSTNVPGTYNYTIEAFNSKGRAATRSGYVVVTKKDTGNGGGTTPPGVTNMDITAVSVLWNPITPVLNFRLNQDGYVRIRVYPTNNSVSAGITITDNQFFTSGAHQFNLTAAQFPNIIGYSYSVEVFARSAKNSTTDTEYTVVNQNGTQPARGCGSFRDVPVGHPLCAAIDFVSSRGIFAGYPDGTLGLNRPIQRAEFLAVIQKGFRFNLDPYSSMSDGYLGYRDLVGAVGQWFMPYVKTFSRLNVMVGYPDHTMRPEKVIGTAEFLVSFFQAAEKSPYAITRYRVNREVDHAPYADTPVTQDTYWYIGYAMFARMHDLIPGNYMYPGRGITRGQVIDFIYQTYQKGIIGYGTDVRNPTYPAQTYQDYYNFNNSPTIYPYVAPVIDNNYNGNTYYDGYQQSQYVGGYAYQNADYPRTPVYTDSLYTNDTPYADTVYPDPYSYNSDYGSNWLWQ